MVVLKSRKHVFWEALFVTVVIFVLGLLLGVAFEANRLNNVNNYYMQSETSLMDSFGLNNLIDLNHSECSVLKSSLLLFADRTYEESKIIDYYESSGKITDNLMMAHKRYDMLRTLLWIDSIKVHEKCGGDFSTVVYLYEYNGEDLNQKAEQNVWSKILFDLKQEEGDNIILIPIAANMDLTSLDVLLSKYDILEYPAVIINDKQVVSDLSSVEDLKAYLK